MFSGFGHDHFQGEGVAVRVPALLSQFGAVPDHVGIGDRFYSQAG